MRKCSNYNYGDPLSSPIEGQQKMCSLKSAMAKSIRSVLSPLLLISSVCGLRIIEFSAGHPKLWFSLLYIPLLWSVYYFFVIAKVISYIPDDSNTYIIYVLSNFLTVLLSIFLGIYYDKKFKYCLKKLAIVDDTLKKLGTTTDYNKLNRRTVWIILGWSVTVSLLNCCEYLRWHDVHDALNSILATLTLNYCSDVNIIDDLIFASILGYLGLKFDQVNEHLGKMVKDNVRRTKRAMENSTLHSPQCKLPSALNSKHMAWIIIHLHLELKKISYEINSIFEIQMTWKMICYFGFIAEFFREAFVTILVRNYDSNKKILFVTIIILWLIWYISRIVLINYMCERVSAKANATRKVISNVLYFSCDVEIRENVSFNVKYKRRYCLN
ncbi:PREDICTED: uncharacterized protein LOC105562376 [Vollenhovia emeryi]|uniref:uncharacterized protein LOC105562376 n=1 Tax=Vollenhovia emeryi TaxID=411798 RepID=UPI0005F37950|nr:PREDICTED: uncharacterized protein LOC105562376 [Vollenhovia emeryi]